MPDRLNGKIAIVTGASRGIGAAIATRFAAEGAKVVISARTLEEDGKLQGSLLKTAERIRAMGGDCHCIRADLADPEDRARIVAETMARFGGVDILVNNAAWARFGPTHKFAHHHVQLAFEVNVFGPLAIAGAAIPIMAERGGGWILNISSGTSLLPPSAPYDATDRYTALHQQGSPTLYGTTKAALERLSAGMAAELAGKNIAVNTLAPVEAVASEGALAVTNWDPTTHVEPAEAMAEAALALCSRSATELSGQIAISLPLLKELGVAVHELGGRELLTIPEPIAG